jgi:hypothetical protein
MSGTAANIMAASIALFFIRSLWLRIDLPCFVDLRV